MERITLKMASRIVQVNSDIISILKDGGHTVETQTCNVYVSRDESIEYQALCKVDEHGVHLYFDARKANHINYPNGQIQARLGGYPSKTLPEPKAGFDCVKLVQTILDDISHDVRKAQQQKESYVRRMTAENFRIQVAERVEAIVAEHHLPRIEVRSDYTEGRVEVLFNQVTPDEAVALAECLKSLRASK